MMRLAPRSSPSLRSKTRVSLFAVASLRLGGTPPLVAVHGRSLREGG